jgi:hypothetical protein
VEKFSVSPPTPRKRNLTVFILVRVLHNFGILQLVGPRRGHHMKTWLAILYTLPRMCKDRRMLPNNALLLQFFFVLRKKDNQVTILHLYHHTVTPLETWVCVKFIAGMWYTSSLCSYVRALVGLLQNCKALGSRSGAQSGYCPASAFRD